MLTGLFFGDNSSDFTVMSGEAAINRDALQQR